MAAARGDGGLMKFTSSLVVAVLGVALAGASARAEGAGACPQPVDVDFTRPKPETGPTPVQVGIHLIDVHGIDDAAETFESDIFLLVQWRDPRLAFGSPCRLPLSEIWSPELLVGNAVRVTSWLEPVARIGEDGSVHYVQRYLGKFRTKLDLREYPFDRQTLPFTLVSIAYGPSEVAATARDATARDFEIAGWRRGPITGRTDNMAGISIQDVGGRQEHLRVHYELQLERDPAAYVRRAIVPLLIIVLMSFAVFWIDPGQIGPQLSVSSVSILSLIAFLFALQRSVPPVPYMTRLDQLVLGSLVLVFLAFIEAVITSTLAGRGRHVLAVRIDRIARWAFLPALVLVAWISLA